MKLPLMPVRIIIYEDNPHLRESIRNLLMLSDDYIVADSFADCMKVEEQVKAIGPDIILMDIDMPGMTGIEGVKRVRTFNRSVQILMITVFDDNSHVFDALYAGANGYLLKKYISDKLVHAIQEVLQGGAPMSPSIARMIIANMQKPAPVSDNDYQLTNREREILQLLSKGNSFKMIAADLCISIDTVRTHIKRIYDKLHVRSQIEAVSKAINERLV
jgi:DNA-binding NarL/FixJ family response regulator